MLMTAGLRSWGSIRLRLMEKGYGPGGILKTLGKMFFGGRYDG